MTTGRGRVAQVQDRAGYDEWIRQQAYPQETMSSLYLREVDFNRYDPLPDAVEAAAEFGVNLHLWYTIFEDDHGGPFLCRFAQDHPAYWQMARDGSTFALMPASSIVSAVVVRTIALVGGSDARPRARKPGCAPGR